MQSAIPKAAWPDFGIQSTGHFQKVKCFNAAQKDTKYLDSFFRVFCSKELLQIDQSGHTAAKRIRRTTLKKKLNKN